MGTFREDFYYRLWWAELEVTPLRARRKDIGLLVEHFRPSVNRRDGLGLDIRGVTREAMAILEGDDWPGNVRELEAVVKREMVCRRVEWVGAEDIVLLRLRRGRLPAAVRALGTGFTSVQEQALRLALSRSEVRRGDLMARCGISRESARKALLDLERVGRPIRPACSYTGSFEALTTHSTLTISAARRQDALGRCDRWVPSVRP